MSRRLRLLNWVLLRAARPLMSRVASPAFHRRHFEFAARVYFHAPRGCRAEAVDLGGVPAQIVRTPQSRADRTLLYLHGGAFAMGSPRTHRALVASIAARTGVTGVLPDYRLAPEHPFPAAPDDCLTAYRALLARGVDPATLVIGGESAGGGLVFTLLADILREGLPLPAAVFALSPVVDLGFGAATIRENAARDVLLPANRVGEVQRHYLAGHDARDPRASPLFADFHGAPPVAIWAGDTEILLDDARRMAAHLKDDGVAVRCDILHDLPHAWPLFHNYLPEARETLDEIADWLSPLWPKSGES